MKQASEEKADSSDEELGKNLNRPKSRRDPITNFFKNGNIELPCCQLVIVGNYNHSKFSKKDELLSDPKYGVLVQNKNISSFLNLGSQDGVSLQIWGASYLPACGHCYGYPIYASATMIVCIPESANDLETFLATLRYAKYGIPKHAKIVYVNMFDTSSEEFKSIEAAAENLRISGRRLVLNPINIDELIKVAILHSREVCNRLIQPRIDPEKLQEPSESKCCVM